MKINKIIIKLNLNENELYIYVFIIKQIKKYASYLLIIIVNNISFTS
jgi:hypothetical protein